MKLTILPETNKYDKERLAKAEAKRKARKTRNLRLLKSGMVTYEWKPSTVTKTDAFKWLKK
jgi:hypothetical protein